MSRDGGGGYGGRHPGGARRQGNQPTAHDLPICLIRQLFRESNGEAMWKVKEQRELKLISNVSKFPGQNG